MRAVVVHESHWGNTAAVAVAIAEGLGAGTAVMTTDEATVDRLAGVDLLVVGAPVIAFSLARGSSRRQIAGDTKAPRPPDLSHPMLREWLEGLPGGDGHGWCAAFETRIWWSPRGATGTIEAKLRAAGYHKLARGERFVVAGPYGPLRDGELQRARAWGVALAATVAERLGDVARPAA